MEAGVQQLDAGVGSGAAHAHQQEILRQHRDMPRLEKKTVRRTIE